MEEKHTTNHESEITCPFCNHVFSDSYEFGECGEQECYECEKKFYYSQHIEVTYSTVGDCKLNEEEHDFQFRHCAEFCTKCGEINRDELPDNSDQLSDK